MALPCIHNHIIEINGDDAEGYLYDRSADNPEQPKHYRRSYMGTPTGVSMGNGSSPNGTVIFIICADAQRMGRKSLTDHGTLSKRPGKTP
jgi:hypothetical protein